MRQKVILCTGGIGSGKSYVLKVFKALGIPSYDCDASAKYLYDTDRVLLGEVAQIVGEDVVKDGLIDRSLFASRIFANPDLLSRVEAAVHPAVIRDFEKWRSNQQSSVVLIESAIMLEKPALKGVWDYVLTVVAPVDIRVDRAVRRDGISVDQVYDRISNQWSDSERMEHSDFVIETNDTQAILPAVLNILKEVNNGIR